MSVALPTIRVGDPLRHEALSVFPLFSEANGGVDYRLSDAALADESLLVEEVSESGSAKPVPHSNVCHAEQTLAAYRGNTDGTYIGTYLQDLDTIVGTSACCNCAARATFSGGISGRPGSRLPPSRRPPVLRSRPTDPPGRRG